MRFHPPPGRGISIAFAVMGIVAGCGPEQRQDGQLIDAKGFNHSLAISPSGKVAIAWTHWDGSPATARASLLDGTEWRQLGGDLSLSDGVGQEQEVSFQPDETLLMKSEDGVSVVHVRRWTGTGWESLGGSDGPFGADQSVEMSRMALDAAGAPVVASRVWTGGRSVTLLRRWDGQAWTAFAGGELADPAGASVSQLGLAFDSADRPVLLRGYGRYGTSVERWDGVAWHSLGGLATLPLEAEGQLAIDSMDTPVVLTEAADGILLQRFDGMTFVPSTPMKLTGGEAYVHGTSLAADGDGGLFAGWEELPAHPTWFGPYPGLHGYVARWTAEGWTLVLAIAPGSIDVMGVHVALGGPFEREPVVAWRQTGAPSESGLFIHVPR